MRMNFFQMSVVAGILVIFIIIIRSLAINKLPKRLFVMLWGVVIARLLIPIEIPIISDIANIFHTKMIDNAITSFRTSNIFHTNSINGGNIQNGNELIHVENMPVQWLSIIWCIGMIFFSMFFLISYVRSTRKLREALPLEDNGWIENWLKANHLRRKIKCLTSDRIDTPMTCGILFPKIILPKIMDTKNSQLMEYIMTHELVHIKYFDNLWKILAILAVSVHWWNPLIWVMYVLLNRDLEISCDEKVIATLGETSKSLYAHTLIDWAEKKLTISLFSSNFGNISIKERIELIMKYSKITKAGVFAATIIITASLSVFAADSSVASYDTENTYSSTTFAVNNSSADFDINNETNVGLTDTFNEDFTSYGITYDAALNQLYYKDEPIYFFADNHATDGHFSGQVISLPISAETGTTGVITDRDKQGNLVGVIHLNEKESNLYSGKYWGNWGNSVKWWEWWK